MCLDDGESRSVVPSIIGYGVREAIVELAPKLKRKKPVLGDKP